MDNLQTYHQARIARDARFDGKFFVAVKSTGIFCRPICPAPSPMEKNVEYFTMAQLAMQAGYRPCLRCRPDSAPQSFAWKGVDTTVERGIKLINQNPELPLEKIAERLGISDRYFRDLFNRKLGIGPKKYQLYEKLLFAKQLLHQSSLSIEQVAQASGFSSARRLQETLRNNLDLTPRQIRQNKPGSEEKLQLRLAFRPPYNWQHLRDFLAVRAIQGVEDVTSESYSRTFSLGSAKGTFTATYNEKMSSLDVDLVISDITSIKLVSNQIRRMFDLDADPEIILKGLSAAGINHTNLLSGIRIPGVWHPFEAGCRAILGQQISVKAAINLVTQLTHELGEKEEHKFFFPTPKKIVESDLQFLKIPGSRRETLRAFAQHCMQKPETEQLEDWLSIKGIGPWTVAYAKLRGQSEPDIWLDTDLVIKKQLQQQDICPDAATPWRSYLTFQLWSMA